MDEFLAEARLLFPYLPEAVLAVFAEAWVTHGTPDLAIAETRNSPIYQQHFPGIRRDDGTLRMSETEYLSTREAYRQVLLENQLNPDLFEDEFTALIEGEVSPREFDSRVSGIIEQIDFGLPEISSFLAQQLEVAGEDGMADQRNAIIFAALKPDVAHRIGSEIAIASLRAEASTRGFTVSAPSALSFLQRGLETPFFNEAAANLPILQTLTSRFSRPDYTLEEFAQAQLGSAFQRNRIQTLYAQERSQFTPQGGVRFGRGGELVGLELGAGR